MTTNAESNIIYLDSYRVKSKPLPETKKRIVRISSELDGMEALYSSDLSPDHLFSVKILFWALLDDGSTCAVIPWLEDLITTDNDEALEGNWQGFYDAKQDRIFFKPPTHKVQELAMAHKFYQVSEPSSKHNDAQLTEPQTFTSRTSSADIDSVRLTVTPQELPDHLGTHAAFKKTKNKGFYLKPIVSWQLTSSGALKAMVPAVDDPNIYPVIDSGNELVQATGNPEFRYYFQHGIAKRIKHKDPNALTVVSLLIDLV